LIFITHHFVDIEFQHTLVLEADKTQIYSRRDVQGVGMVYAKGLKFADSLAEAIHAYILGMHSSAISLPCIAAERLCYDFIDSI
jgi:hypothetical protein